MTTHTLTATATDPIGVVDTDTVTINSTTSAAPRVVRRSLLENRTNWGSVVDPARGPLFSNDHATDSLFDVGKPPPNVAPPDTLTICHQFKVLIPCKLTGFRVYKAPAAVNAGGVPWTLWSGSDYLSGTVAASGTGPVWASDAGGWRQFTLTTPADLTPGTVYTLGYLALGGVYAYTAWVWNGQSTVVWPFLTVIPETSSGVAVAGTSASGYNATTPTDMTFPTRLLGQNYYIDPQVTWTDTLPAFTYGSDYWQQFSTPYSRHAFPFAIFNSDAENLADYYAAGFNTQIRGELGRQDFIDAMNAMGNVMDWWPAIDRTSTATMQAMIQVLSEEPGIASQVVGYHLDDEPDMTPPYRSPTYLREIANFFRVRDSTRPIYLGFGIFPNRNQGFAWQPTGATPLLVNQNWREYADIADLLSIDDYTLSYAEATPDTVAGQHGVWAYANQVKKLKEISDDRKPVWVTIEMTQPNFSTSIDIPSPDICRKAFWATIIAGATGVVWFDHRFASDFLPQDFAAGLHHPPMKAMLTALSARCQTLATALLSADLGLVTAWTSSNTTAGPLGGTFGVPIHYTTRSDGTYEYCFAQAIRPGATTATITIPSWAGEVVDVLDESRTETVSGAGVLTDDFAADYQFHLYRRTP